MIGHYNILIHVNIYKKNVRGPTLKKRCLWPATERGLKYEVLYMVNPVQTRRNIRVILVVCIYKTWVTFKKPTMYF